MTNLHAAVRGAITAINPDITGTLKRSTGYTMLPNGKQVPTYSFTDGRIQVQALGTADLKHLEFLNIQGVERKVYMYGDWGGPIRADATGGDILAFPMLRAPSTVRDWKIVTVFETWDNVGGEGWCAVGVVMQKTVITP